MGREPTFVEHEIAWTKVYSERIWKYISSNKSYEDQYFSKRHGESIIRLARNANIPLGGKVLDFGCGPGFLLEKLLRRRIRCQGLDFSGDSIRAVHERVGKHPSFDGVIHADSLPLRIDSDTFDVVFFIETIEHLLADDLEATIVELRRIIKEEKYLVVTTPNDEILEREKVLCPECGCIFHRMQHVRSWNRVSLSRYMSDHGFQEILCKEMTLIEESFRSIAVSIWNTVSGARKPNLIYIGKKRPA